MLLLLMAVVTSGPSTVASCSDSRSCSVELSAAQVFDLARRLESENKFDEAIAVLKAATQDNNSNYRAEARVRIARIFIAKGEFRTAAAWFERLLDEKPNAAAVRVELAQLLARMGEEQGAARQLRKAEAAGLPPEVSRALRNATNAFRSNAPFGAQFSIGFAPDTNINAATSAQTVDVFGLPFQLDGDARAQSGVGLTLSGELVARQRLGGKTRLIEQVSATGSFYRTNTFNDVTLSANVGPEIGGGKVRFRPTLTAGRRIFGVDKLYDYFGVAAAVQFRLGLRAQSTLTASATDLRYATDRAVQSGTTYAMIASYERVINPVSSLRLSATVSRIQARDPGYAAYSGTVDATVSRDFGHFTAFSRVSYGQLKADADFLFFGVKRRDKVYEGEAGLIFRRFLLLGLAPQVRVKYTTDDSSITLFRYRRLRTEIDLVKSF